MRVDDSSQRRTRATLSNHFQKLTTLTLISFSFIVSLSRKKEKETVHQPTLSRHLFYASNYKLIYRFKVLDNQGIILSKENPILNRKSNSTNLIGHPILNW